MGLLGEHTWSSEVRCRVAQQRRPALDGKSGAGLAGAGI